MRVHQMGNLHFKHLFGVGTNEWGALGFPSSQKPTAALKAYRREDLVLLAITKNPDPDVDSKFWSGFEGKIHAICTLLYGDVEMSKYANPDLVKRYPLIANRWRRATPIDKMWHLTEPKPYEAFGAGKLQQLAQQRRGHLIPLAPHPKIQDEIWEWLAGAVKQEVEVYRSSRALILADRRTQI